MSLMESIAKAGASGATMIVWGLTAVLILGSVNEARLLVTSRQSLQVAEATAPPSVEVKDVPIDQKEYEKVADMVRQMHPQLKVGYDSPSKSIFTEASDLAAYYEWLISIYDIMTAIPNARWTTVEMCAGDGCQRVKYRIVMSAVRREINIKN
ncbi:MAG: hypothetical protein EYC62_09260 [Alphaproteobacteria bacterium]|nr:MAG: hypothetical protein EYC62_09260 [Alphaproteobacteria bacterium]